MFTVAALLFLDSELRLWTREAGAGTLAQENGIYRVEHKGKQDWSLQADESFKIKPGDLIEVRAIGRREGNAEVAAAVFDAKQEALDWMLGATLLSATANMASTVTRFIAPERSVTYRPRIVGSGPGKVWLSKLEARLLGSVADQLAKVPPTTTIQRAPLQLTLNRDGSAEVIDLRNKRTWHTTDTESGLLPTDIAKTQDGIEVKGLDPKTALERTVSFKLAGDEVRIALHGQGAVRWLEYPGGFETPAGSSIVLPMNEGIAYPVEDPDVPQWTLVAYGGHGICMPWWGVADRGAACMTLLETPDDAGVRLRRVSGLSVAGPAWEGQKGQFGYARKMRWRFFAKGDHVSMAKAYRAYVKAQGRLVTLAEKRKTVPAVDKLLGAVNLWTWDAKKAELAKGLKAAGMDRVLWSGGGDPGQLRAIRDLGFLAGRYDIVQDVMDPAQYPNLPWTHPDWPAAAWPKDLMRGPDGDWIKGWEVDDKQGKRVPCGVLCDRQAIPYVDERIGNELKTHPYEARFMDTTTASPWRECYDRNHPVTRTESRIWKMKLLELMSGKYHLVTGSETGHDAAVPYVHYFEGMLSLGPYRTEDAGRDMTKEWAVPPKELAHFQLGYKYRLPLWELVYHDCVVAQWYWGDHSHKLPSLWTLRDRFNALYGTPPLFWLTLDRFQKEPARFLQSYLDTVPIARATAYAEMTAHRFLTPDRTVQETEFSNGVRVRVNFGDREVKLKDGVDLPGLGLWWRKR
ncbi:MAG: hypothetical protein HZC36_01185 [Armatimonadetes bacterium]|nr:hypothetical protein [Armatimonadota bacterium]